MSDLLAVFESPKCFEDKIIWDTNELACKALYLSLALFIAATSKRELLPIPTTADAATTPIPLRKDLLEILI